MTKAETIMNKLAESQPTYPLSRGYETLQNIKSYSLAGFVKNRALQGRANTGKGIISSGEKEVAKAIEDKNSKKTFPISRFLTNPITSAVAMGAIAPLRYEQIARKANLPITGKSGWIAAGVGAALGGASSLASRWAHARALKGRAEVDRTGWGYRERDILKHLKEKNK